MAILADKFGRRPLLIFSMIFGSISIVVMGLSINIWMI